MTSYVDEILENCPDIQQKWDDWFHVSEEEAEQMERDHQEFIAREIELLEKALKIMNGENIWVNPKER